MVVRKRSRRWLLWPLGFACFAVTVLGAAAPVVVLPLHYQATAQVILVLPTDARSTRIETSPFVYMPDGLIALARASILTPRSDEFRQSMIEAGLDSTYELDAEITTPIVRFSVEGQDASNVDATTTELLRRFDALVSQTQAEANAPARQTARVVTVQLIPAAPISGDQHRAVGMIALTGSILTILLLTATAKRFRDPGPDPSRTLKTPALATADRDG